MIDTTLFENTDDCYKVLFGFVDVLLDKYEDSTYVDEKDWDLDDFTIATFQFMNFVYNAKWDFIINHRL